MLLFPMAFDFFDLQQMRKTHPSWRLMNADNSPLIISFFDRVFREKNLRQISEDELIMQLEDYLFDLRDQFEEDPFPRSAGEYLDEWTAPGREWLRKFYPPESDTVHFDLTPGSERVLQWADGLFGSNFVGTESRLNSSFELLRQIVKGVEEDRNLRLKELEDQKKRINQEIREVKEGHVLLLDDRQVRERFIQFRRIARELLSDFRAVEHHFRELDLEVREQIAAWEGEKGELLEDFFGSHDRITDSDEGQSFKAFWDFLMSPSSQEEFSLLLDRVYELGALHDLTEDRRLRRIHFDWISAGEQTQRVVARLSRQLRRYLDDRAFWENRRITEILDGIEKRAIQVKETPPQGDIMSVKSYKANIAVPMANPLFSPPPFTELVSVIETAGNDEIDTSRLFDLVFVDRARLIDNIERELDAFPQIRLQEIIEKNPLEEGLAELITYVDLAEQNPLAIVVEELRDSVSWSDRDGKKREARFPRIIFSRKERNGTI